jgi:hypothetical protein
MSYRRGIPPRKPRGGGRMGFGDDRFTYLLNGLVLGYVSPDGIPFVTNEMHEARLFPGGIEEMKKLYWLHREKLFAACHADLKPWGFWKFESTTPDPRRDPSRLAKPADAPETPTRQAVAGNIAGNDGASDRRRRSSVPPMADPSGASGDGRSRREHA